MVKVMLLGHTPDPERIIAMAARQTRLEGLVTEEEIGKDRVERIIELLLTRKHLSPFEHASFTFLIWDISRVCSHQLVRHRLASFSQQSQRVIRVIDTSFIVPPSVRSVENARRLFEKAANEAIKAYHELIKLGIPEEDARFILPQAIETKVVMTMNARELFHFFGLRLCKKAQWEIRELAEQMLEVVKNVAHSLFKYAGPRCWEYNYCPEGDGECFAETIRKRPW